MEALWAGFLLVLFLVMFFWGRVQYLNMMRPPDDAMEVYVVGRQWMWQLQHPGGQREINELHVPVGQPVKLIMTSEDVIHDFFVPAFRVKQDVVPGRYTYTVVPGRPRSGDYHLFCAEYCGTEHSRMVGWVHVMEPEEYQTWLSEQGRPVDGPATAGSCSSSPVHHLPQRRQPGPGPAAGRAVRQHGAAATTAARSRPTRTTSASRSCDPKAKVVVRLRADHAGALERPTTRMDDGAGLHEADRLHQVAAAAARRRRA